MGVGISIVTGTCITEADRTRPGGAQHAAILSQRSHGAVMRKGRFPSAEARAFVGLFRPGLLTHHEHDDFGHSQR